MLKIIIELSQDVGISTTPTEVLFVGLLCLSVVAGMALYAVILSVKALGRTK